MSRIYLITAVFISLFALVACGGGGGGGLNGYIEPQENAGGGAGVSLGNSEDDKQPILSGRNPDVGKGREANRLFAADSSDEVRGNSHVEVNPPSFLSANEMEVYTFCLNNPTLMFSRRCSTMLVRVCGTLEEPLNANLFDPICNVNTLFDAARLAHCKTLTSAQPDGLCDGFTELTEACTLAATPFAAGCASLSGHAEIVRPVCVGFVAGQDDERIYTYEGTTYNDATVEQCDIALLSYCDENQPNSINRLFSSDCEQISDLDEIIKIDARRGAACIAGYRAKCAGNLVFRAACEANPYTAGAGCNGLADIAKLQNSWCALPENASNDNCPDYQRWLAGFSPPLPDTPTQSDGAFFARTGANNQIIEVAGSTNQYHRILRFDESDLVDSDTAGDKPISGISLLSATVGTSRYFAAGLTQNAQVGAPIVDTRTDVQWAANIAMLYGKNTSTEFNTDFNLCLNFAQRSFFARNNKNNCDAQYGKRIKNTNGGATPHLKITKGTWDENGLISVTRGLVFNDGNSNITGRLMGLIGQQGAIAVFNGSDTDTHFVGGFVAKNPDFVPPVPTVAPGSFAAWEASFADGALLAQGGVLTVASATGTYFIAGSEVGLDGVNATVLRLNDLTGVSDAMGGIAYGSAEVGEHTQYYAGLLAGADVGPVLLDAPPEGGWQGRVSLLAQNGSIVNQPVSLTFNFEYNHFSNGTTKTFGDDTFTFLGTWDKSGVITGTANFDEDGDSAGVVAQSGSLTGLIGQSGVLGVFKSDDATSNPFVGGFVAHPSATASNDE